MNSALTGIATGDPHTGADAGYLGLPRENPTQKRAGNPAYARKADAMDRNPLNASKLPRPSGPRWRGGRTTGTPCCPRIFPRRQRDSHHVAPEGSICGHAASLGKSELPDSNDHGSKRRLKI